MPPLSLRQKDHWRGTSPRPTPNIRSHFLPLRYNLPMVNELADAGISGAKTARFKGNKLVIFLGKLLLGFAVAEATHWVYLLALEYVLYFNDIIESRAIVAPLLLVLLTVLSTLVVALWIIASWCLSAYRGKAKLLLQLLITLSFIALWLYRFGFFSSLMLMWTGRTPTSFN
jgi:hypothetical protein